MRELSNFRISASQKQEKRKQLKTMIMACANNQLDLGSDTTDVFY